MQRSQSLAESMTYDGIDSILNLINIFIVLTESIRVFKTAIYIWWI